MLSQTFAKRWRQGGGIMERWLPILALMRYAPTRSCEASSSELEPESHSRLLPSRLASALTIERFTFPPGVVPLQERHCPVVIFSRLFARS